MVLWSFQVELNHGLDVQDEGVHERQRLAERPGCT